MILDLDQFIQRERPYWDELLDMMRLRDNQPSREAPLAEVQRFLYLYQRASADLVKLKTFAGDVEVRAWLENVVARAYSQLHERRAEGIPFRPWKWLSQTFPQTFRRHWRAFVLSSGTFWAGALLGAIIMMWNPEMKTEFIPAQFSHTHESPSKRVEREEKQEFDAFAGRQSFSTQLMANNIKVSILAMVSGITYGVLTIVILFSNGLLIGIIGCDYLLDGQGVFLTAWLLPHGSWELPAIFIGGQAGLVIARAMFGWGTNLRLRQRFARIRDDLLTLIGGAALLMVGAGLVESFLSQYHSPNLYPWKIAFGAFQLAILFGYLVFCGRGKDKPKPGKTRL
ncbi:MAG: stage II sporulation protein M [Verrucomicrobiae bacterium]|nr:stage II sporulation protein M [Verrucomicrobiae bacterium]